MVSGMWISTGFLPGWLSFFAPAGDTANAGAGSAWGSGASNIARRFWVWLPHAGPRLARFVAKSLSRLTSSNAARSSAAALPFGSYSVAACPSPTALLKSLRS